MSITDLFLKTPEQLEGKSLSQLIAFIGDGKLRDGNSASQELRTYLGHVTSGCLEAYAKECLDKGFPESGLALQDIINEFGKRLGFSVEPGRYRGSLGQIGNDGIWRFPDGHAIVIEVKTSDTYRVPLDTIAKYRQDLILQGHIKEDESSILIVVGKENTGELEAQIRGSRHAWDMRLISVDALTDLLRLKEKVEDPATTSRIHQILIPMEFTKLDSIVDIIISATDDVQSNDEIEENDVLNDDDLQRLAPLAAKKGYVALGCGSENNLLLIPFSDFKKWLSGMNITRKDDRFYYHVQISFEADKYVLVRKKGEQRLDLTNYLIANKAGRKTSRT